MILPIFGFITLLYINGNRTDVVIVDILRNSLFSQSYLKLQYENILTDFSIIISTMDERINPH